MFENKLQRLELDLTKSLVKGHAKSFVTNLSYSNEIYIIISCQGITFNHTFTYQEFKDKTCELLLHEIIAEFNVFITEYYIDYSYVNRRVYCDYRPDEDKG